MAPERSTEVLKVDPRLPDPTAIRSAAEVLRRGGLVAFPTETVYGLGANALDARAVRSIFLAKGRPADDPLIVHIASADELRLVADEIPAEAARLAGSFWPGPLTLVLPRAAAIPLEATAGLDTVGVRVPDHPVALALIAAAELPLAAPSANRFGHTSPTTAQHVLHDLQGRIDLVLDGGPTRVGVESTVLDLRADPPRVLRPGGASVEALERVLGRPVQVGTARGPARAPGQLLRHYAPRARLELFDGNRAAVLHAVADRARSYLKQGKRVGLLLADQDPNELGALRPADRLLVQTVGPQDDLAEIARRLYAALRELDARSPDVILARTFGTRELGLAIADRLARAAEGRVTRVES